MITLDQAKRLRPGNIIYHVAYTNADGSPQRWRVNGRIKLWKTRPKEFQVPIKHALRDYWYLDDFTAKVFCLTEREARYAR